jgi:hypothetical protein
MSDNLTGQQETETQDETVTAETAASSTTQKTEVRNPDRLLELFNAQKEELKALKAYREAKEAELAQAEAERLAAQGQYEALIPIKIDEALKPVNEKLIAEQKRAEKSEADLAKAKAEYDALKAEIKLSAVKDAVYGAFTNPKVGGDPATGKDAFWKLYGSEVKFDADGRPTDLDELFTNLKADSFGAKLFLATTPEGSGTPPQSGVSRSAGKASPKVITQSEFNKRGNGYTIEQVISGEISIRG